MAKKIILYFQWLCSFLHVHAAFSFNKRTLFLVVCDCDGGDEYDDKYDVMLLNGGSKWSDGNPKYN